MFLVSASKSFLAITKCKTFCSLWGKIHGRTAVELVTRLISSQRRVPQLPGSNEISRSDSCRSDTCPPISSQTAQGVNKPKDSISVFTRRREGGDQLEKNYCQQSPRRTLSYCIPPFPLFSNRMYFQKR